MPSSKTPKKESKKVPPKELENIIQDARELRSSQPLSRPLDPSGLGEENGGTKALLERAAVDLRVVQEISNRSGNLKGTCQKGIKEAVKSVAEVVQLLSEKSFNEETQRLERELQRLREENTSLKKQMDDLQAQINNLSGVGERARRTRRRGDSDSSLSPSPAGPRGGGE